MSRFMKTLQEPIAKRANAEDGVKGRFFEGRFKSQILLSQNAILAAMAYVDLNPVRAKIVASLGKSKNTGIKLRIKKIAKNQALAHKIWKGNQEAKRIFHHAQGRGTPNTCDVSADSFHQTTEHTPFETNPGQMKRIFAME